MPCTITDRLSSRQYPRSHVETLESKVEQLQARISELEIDNTNLRNQVGSSSHLGQTQNEIPAGLNGFEDYSTQNAPAARTDTSPTIRQNPGSSNAFSLTESSNALPFITATQPAWGIVGGEERPREVSHFVAGVVTADVTADRSSEFESLLPDRSLCEQLQGAYFTHRWPALPFLHRPRFLEEHFGPVMEFRSLASPPSIFLTLMVLALGAIDALRLDESAPRSHRELFSCAIRFYSAGLLSNDDITTVQGLLLVVQYAVNEPKSANSWQIAGQAVRLCIELGLHRMVDNLQEPFLKSEMAKRVFWSAYAIERNIAINLGRPFAVRDADIGTSLPQLLTDDELLSATNAYASPASQASRPEDISSFVHIVKLRKLQAHIQDTFYSATNQQMTSETAQDIRKTLRDQLDEWLSSSPRYVQRVESTFESSEWRQIAFSHTLLLLHRPSPACPTIDEASLKICYESAISLISSYSSLYAQKKVTYTWIAFQSLFMASITMLYTLWMSSVLRASTRKNIVRSNVMSCLALFDVMSDFWPMASKCFDVVERLGNATVKLFETADSVSDTSSLAPGGEHDFGRITAEFTELFADRELSRLREPKVKNQDRIEEYVQAQANVVVDVGSTFDGFAPIDNMMDFSGMFEDNFDIGMPLMMTAFGNEPVFSM